MADHRKLDGCALFILWVELYGVRLKLETEESGFHRYRLTPFSLGQLFQCVSFSGTFNLEGKGLLERTKSCAAMGGILASPSVIL